MNKLDTITSKKFVDICDFVFSEVITAKDYSNLSNKKELIIFDKNEENVLYQKNNLNISDNSVIFCTSFMVKDLFSLLKKIKNVKNITLITHQGDNLIEQNIFRTRPKSISRWFSTNVGFANESLIPIPIGISNYNMKNLNELHFQNLKSDSFFRDKENFLYINFQKNTNNKERDGVYENFKFEKWAYTEQPDQTLINYKSTIQNSSFILSPWGNGIDTHRIWEALYLGSIPITKYHHTLSTLSGLPVLFVNNYSEISEYLLNEYLIKNSNTKFNFEKLNFSYWKSQILSGRDIQNAKSYYLVNNRSVKPYKFKKFIERYTKIIMFFLKKIKKIFKFPL